MYAGNSVWAGQEPNLRASDYEWPRGSPSVVLAWVGGVRSACLGSDLQSGDTIRDTFRAATHSVLVHLWPRAAVPSPESPYLTDEKFEADWTIFSGRALRGPRMRGSERRRRAVRGILAARTGPPPGACSAVWARRIPRGRRAQPSERLSRTRPGEIGPLDGRTLPARVYRHDRSCRRRIAWARSRWSAGQQHTQAGRRSRRI
jgi:hypothetical protein